MYDGEQAQTAARDSAERKAQVCGLHIIPRPPVFPSPPPSPCSHPPFAVGAFMMPLKSLRLVPHPRQEKLRESQRAMDDMSAEQSRAAQKALEEAEAARKELEEARGMMTKQEQELSGATAR